MTSSSPRIRSIVGALAASWVRRVSFAATPVTQIAIAARAVATGGRSPRINPHNIASTQSEPMLVGRA